MAVLPASRRVNLRHLQESIGADEVTLSSEAEFNELFPDCEVGAMPPFGNLYDMGVYVAEQLTEDDEIAFNAGSHSELVKMSYERGVDRGLIRSTGVFGWRIRTGETPSLQTFLR